MVTHWDDLYRLICQTQLSQTKRMEEDLGINIMTSLQNIIIINKLSRDAGNISCDSNSPSWFYPRRVHMYVGLLWCVWRLYFVSTGICGLHGVVVPILSIPSVNSGQLRLIVMSWIVNNSLNTSNFVPEKVVKLASGDNCIKLDTCDASGETKMNACEGHDTTDVYTSN